MNRLLIILLIFYIVAIYNTKDNLNTIIIFSIFSFTSASLYFLNSAPDIALAEIAIGCAFVPLIYTIAIFKRKVLTVVFYNELLDGTRSGTYMQVLDFYKLLDEFCDFYDFKLKLVTHPKGYNPTVHGIFRVGNVDILASIKNEDRKIKIWLNSKNIMYMRMEDLAKKYENIEVIKVDD
ncbi:MAG: DUF4040 domain-containing protein [Firmicutes bacterium]|jgi:uncharacterized MnhB-related membrane protein|nr:DUF4040 domain-containing protein [Bacillota bacterium]